MRAAAAAIIPAVPIILGNRLAMNNFFPKRTRVRDKCPFLWVLPLIIGTLMTHPAAAQLGPIPPPPIGTTPGTAADGGALAAASANLAIVTANVTANAAALATVQSTANAAIPSAMLGHPNGPVQLDGSATASSTTTMAMGTSTARTLAARAADIFNPRDYGAIGDGTLHTAQAVLGVSTLASLAGYTAPNGSKPYAWLNQYPHGTLFNLPVSQAVAIGAQTLSFGVTKTVGLVLTTTVQTNSGGTSLTFAGLYGAYPGTPVSGACIPAG